MGTLFDQLPRKGLPVDLEGSIKEMSRIAHKYNCSLSDVIALKTAMEQERANNLRVENGDIWDEQIAGIGRILQNLTAIVNSK